VKHWAQQNNSIFSYVTPGDQKARNLEIEHSELATFPKQEHDVVCSQQVRGSSNKNYFLNIFFKLTK